MKTFILSLLFFASFQQTKANALGNFDKQEYYKILKAGGLDDVSDEILLVQSSGLLNKDAFEGTLLMKKAGLVEKAKDKLDLFKSGRIKLETAIKNDSTNVEYRFMRLIIQEHAPKVVKNQSQLKSDADYITKNFKTLSPDLQEIVNDYSKTSKTLQTKNLQL